MNIATVDAHGCDYVATSGGLYPAYGLSIWCDNHIGVGSNVVCSTTTDNASVLIRGIDNRKFPRLFCVQKKPIT